MEHRGSQFTFLPGLLRPDQEGALHLRQGEGILKEEQREKRREKEKKYDTGIPSSDEARSAALFSKEAFIP